jgi:hypothetical protein
MTHLRKAMLEGNSSAEYTQNDCANLPDAVEEFARFFKPPDWSTCGSTNAHLFTDRKLEAVRVAQQLSALWFFL